MTFSNNGLKSLECAPTWINRALLGAIVVQWFICTDIGICAPQAFAINVANGEKLCKDAKKVIGFTAKKSTVVSNAP